MEDDVKMKDVKKGAREVENKAKETWRKLDGDESPSDKLGNLGDDVRHGLGNAGDEITDAVKTERAKIEQSRNYPEESPK